MTLPQVAFRERIYAGIVTTVPMLGMIAFIALINLFEIRKFEWISFLAFYLFGEVGAEVGHHRYFSHRAFTANRFLKLVLTIAASISGKGSIFEFAAVHRKHHQYADQEQDPHSPHTGGVVFEKKSFRDKIRGFFHAYYGWVYRIQMSPAEHARVLDLLKDADLVRFGSRRMYYVWMLAGLLVPGALAWIWYGDFESALRGVLISGLVRVFFQQHTAFLINSVCHIWGSRPFKTADHAKNNTVLALLTLGVGWHNNHHAFPFTAYNSFRWWQIDMAGWFIHFSEMIGLASKCQYPTAEQMRAKENES